MITGGDVSEPTVDVPEAPEAPLPNALVTVAQVTQIRRQLPWLSLCLALLGMRPGWVLLMRFASAAPPAHWRGYVDAGIALWKAIALLGVGGYLGMHFGPRLQRRLQAWVGGAPIDAPMRVRMDSAGVMIEGLASIPWSSIRRNGAAEAEGDQIPSSEAVLDLDSAEHGRIRLRLDAQAVEPLLARYYQDPFAEPWRLDK
ncbi:hypothetical protein ACS7SF_04230 [Ralstonia sp. 25C]|uniref:hypothetical protein n=1 Tax=Ralstonia sp. 25C TaxID=3447363 RepID=UPI003F7565C7